MRSGVVVLSGIETALLNVGRAVVTPLFTRWLGGRRRDRERTLPLSELLKQKATDEFTRRRGERQIEAVVDEVAERLKPLITSLPENEALAALDAVADTFRRADLTDDALFAADLDPARLIAHLRASTPPAALSEVAERLYEVALQDCARCFVQFVVQTAPFTGRAAVQILSRLSELTGLMSETLRQLALAVPETATGFLARYQDFLVKKLNALELVGLDTQFRPRTTLSVAYISLAVSGDGTPARSRLPQWDPGMVRHAQPDGSGLERVEQALAWRTRTLIRGEAGAGKSTLLRWLAVTAAANGFTGALADWNGRIPFLIKLRSWPGELPKPERFLTGVADPLEGAMPSGWVHAQLLAGRGLLLVDGVDELPAERRSRVREWLRDLLDAYSDMVVVVTSRPPAAPVRWLETEGFDSLSLERLTPTDVRALIDQWHRAARTSPPMPRSAAELHRYEQSLLTQLAANRHLYRLAGNPLMAAMLCALNLDRKTHLPPDRMGIYQAAVDMLLHRRDSEREVHSTLAEMTVRERLQLLQDLAWRLSLNGRSELPRAEAEDCLSRRLDGMPRIPAKAGPVLQHLLERSGLLREPAVGRIDFVHRTFQEYLAAREAAEQNMGGFLVGQAHLDSWREIIIMAAGHANSPMRTELLAGILRRADREQRHRRVLVLLAASCLETLPALDPPLVAALNARVDRLLPPRHPNEARSLSIIGEPLLRKLPRDSTELTEAQARAAVRTAALTNGPHAIPVLAGYARDPRPAVQRELADAWIHFDPEEYAVEVLAEAPLDYGHIWIEQPALLDAARHLRNLSGITAHFNGSVNLDELAPAPQLKSLFLFRDWTGNTASLHRYPELSVLSLSPSERQVHSREIRALREFPGLQRLYLQGTGLTAESMSAISALDWLIDLAVWLGEVGDVAPLAELTRLRTLHLGQGTVDSFAPFAACPVESLALVNVHSDKAPRAELRRAFDRLTEIWLYSGDWPDDLAFIAGLPRLERLLASGDMVTRLATLAAPPTLREVHLSGGAKLDLAALVAHTGLRGLNLSQFRGSLDLSPLERWSGDSLLVTLGVHQKASGRDRLPRQIRIRRQPQPVSLSL